MSTIAFLETGAISSIIKKVDRDMAVSTQNMEDYTSWMNDTMMETNRPLSFLSQWDVKWILAKS